jgi:hypothetical protein
MMAQVVAQTALTDVEEGGVAHTLMGVVATQIELTEQRILQLYRSFGFAGGGTDLDDRVAQLPGFLGRLGAAAASGSVMRFTRSGSTAATLLVPAGVRVRSSINRAQEYVTTEDFTFAIGQNTYPISGGTGVRVAALSLGSASNAPVGSLRVLVQTTEQAVVGCTNFEPLTNGSDRETDESLRKRAFDFFSSLCQVTPAALEYLARSFQASDGTRCRFAFVVSDPNFPAYARLIVDDGSGMQGVTRAGNMVSGVVPLNGQRVFWYEGPASTVPTVEIDGEVYLPNDPRSEWVFALEQGLGYLTPDSTILGTPGDPWSVYDYRVYTGFIAELQQAIEGVISLASRTPGWKPAGGRIQVMPPTLEFLNIGASVVIESGFDPNEVRSRVKAAIVAFFGGLRPGSPLRLFDLYSALDDVDGLLNIVFAVPAVDQYPANEWTKFYTMTSMIDLEV